MKKSDRKMSVRLGILTTLIILVIWMGLTSLKLVSPILLPTPLKVYQAFIKTCMVGYNGTPLYLHYLITMRRLAVAVFCSVIFGVPLGLISGYVPKIKGIVDPIIQFLRPIPPLAYYTLLILWLGIGEVSKVMLLFLAALPPIYLSCFDAVFRINQEYIRSAASLGANSQQIFFRVIIPAALPDIFTGLRSAVGVAYTTIVSAEMIAASSGIGWMIIDASHYLKSDVMFVGIIVLGITGVALDWLIKVIENRIVHWQGKV